MRFPRYNQRGQTAILFTMAITMVCGMLGLVVDVGYAYYRMHAAQAAADAAAMAAGLAAYAAASGGTVTCSTGGVACYSVETGCPAGITTPANNIQNGCLYAQQNGFTNSGRQTVTFQSGSGDANGATLIYWTKVKVIERLPQLFSAAMGNTNAMVAATSTSGIRAAAAGGCVFALDPTASGALSMNGTTSLTSGCGVFVNSNSSDAINIVGSARITTTGTTKTQIVGDWSGSGTISPAPQTGVPTTIDPLGDMQAPTVGSCTNNGIILGSHDNLTISTSTGYSVICNGISLGSHATLTLQPGLYIVKGGISMGAQTTITGSGVTIYLADSGITMAGGATANLSAPTSGDWEGILFFQARGDTTTSSLVGGTAQNLSGLIYFPSSTLTYTGGSSVNATSTTIVSNKLSLAGNSYISQAAATRFTGITGGVFLVN